MRAAPSLPRVAPSTPEPCDVVEVAETLRDRSGTAPIAGVGDNVGEGESALTEGCLGTECCCSFVVAMMMMLYTSAAYSHTVCRGVAGDEERKGKGERT